MPPLHDALDELSGPAARDLLRKIREVLWPEDDPAADWSPDHLDSIGELFATLRLPTIRCGRCNREVHAHRSRTHQGVTLGPCCWDERLRSTE